MITFLGENFSDSYIPQPPTCVNPSPPPFDATSLTHPPTTTKDVASNGGGEGLTHVGG